MGKLIVANYKMNGNINFYKNVQKKFKNIKLQDTKVILCPPFVYLPIVKINNKNVEIGSQDISNNVDNKSTGQISPLMLKELGVAYCLIGHCERRVLGENLTLIKEKIFNAVANNVQPIICIDKKENLSDLNKEIRFLLENQKEFNPIFVYEPSEAINSNVASVQEINLVVHEIQSVCKKLNFNCKILYGGGVNAESYHQIKDAKIDGFLLGSVCLNLNETISLIKEVENE